MGCNRFTKRVYYTFADCLQIIHDEATAYKPLEIDYEQMTFLDLYDNLFGGTVATETQTILNGTESAKLFGKYLFTKNAQMCVAYEDMDIHEDTPSWTGWAASKKIEIFGEFVTNLANIFLSTYERYKKLLDSYSAKASSLLGQISSTNTNKTRFNDTPQDSSETFFDDDEHTTNVTLNESTISSDGSTPMARLEEIRNLYANLYNDWCNEFDSLFYIED